MLYKLKLDGMVDLDQNIFIHWSGWIKSDISYMYYDKWTAMAFAVRLVEAKRLRGNYDRIARLTFRGN